jgi:hypothetical protein
MVRSGLGLPPSANTPSLKTLRVQDLAQTNGRRRGRGNWTARFQFLISARPGLRSWTGAFRCAPGGTLNVANDHEMLRYGLVIYDALYRWHRDLRGETHNWPPIKTA